MSRWIEYFEKHPFQDTWSQILSLKDSISPDDKTIITDTTEIARLKKVVAFINELLLACDPELIPEQTWSNFSSQATACLQSILSFNSSRNIQHIIQANSNLDNLLTYIRPYQVITGKAARAAKTAFSSYTKEISISLDSMNREITTKFDSIQSDADYLLDEIEKIKNNAASELENCEIISEKITNLDEDYFNNSVNKSLKTRMEEFESEITQAHEKILNFSEILFEGTSTDDSVEHKIQVALDEIESDAKESASQLVKLRSKIDDFSNYYNLVFGELQDDENRKGGLKSEIDTRKKELERFKETQELKYKTLVEEIESLLPSATSAGLASAYREMKISFDGPIIKNTMIFYGTIACLIFTALVSMTQELGWFYIKFHNIPELTTLASNILYKAPIIIPVIWLALFSSKRRSEALRLQQEYAHKEALAKSFQNFKAQIEALGEETPVLMNKLLEAAIDAVSKNASDTLDKKHGDKTPVHQTLDGALDSLGKIKSLLEPKKPQS